MYSIEIEAAQAGKGGRVLEKPTRWLLDIGEEKKKYSFTEPLE
jgi:hypothetical protein